MQLEEFRRKRAAKKATSTNVINEKQPSETENVRLTDSNGVGTSDALAEGRLETSTGVPKIADKEYDVSSKSDFASSSNKNVNSSLLDRNNDFNASTLVHSYSNNEEYRDDASSIHLDEYRSAKDKLQSRKDEYGASNELASGIGKSYLFGHKVPSAEENYASSSFTSDGLDKYPSNDIHRPEKDVAPASCTTSSTSTADIMLKDFVSSFGNSRHEDNKLSASLYPGKTISLEHVPVCCCLIFLFLSLQKLSDKVCFLLLYFIFWPSYGMIESHHSSSNIDDPAFGFKQKFSMFSGTGEKKIGSTFNHLESTNHSSSWTSDEKFSGYNSEAQSSLNHGPPSPPASGRRSRPSFLDSIQISKSPSSSPLLGTEKTDLSSSKVYPVDGLGSSVSQRLASTSVASSDGVGLFNNHIMEDKHNFFSQKQNEDFAALEQVHILLVFSRTCPFFWVD